MREGRLRHTIQTRVIRLNMCLLYNAILDDKGVALRTVTTEDGCSVEGKVEAFGQCQAGVCEEANLRKNNKYSVGIKRWLRIKLTPLEPEGSKVLPHAFMLCKVSY